jgi:hypothetical protein
MDLNYVYMDLLKKVALGYQCEMKGAYYSYIKPEFKRIQEIEDISFILLERKARYIFSHYYLPKLDDIVEGKHVSLPSSMCVESIRLIESNHRALDIVFRRARIFPTVYSDFLVLSKLSKGIKVSKVNLYFKKVSAKMIAPYFTVAIERLGIKDISDSCMKWSENIRNMYYKIVLAEVKPRQGRILKQAAFYFAHVEKMIERLEARKIYYALRYINGLDPKICNQASFELLSKLQDRIREKVKQNDWVSVR